MTAAVDEAALWRLLGELAGRAHAGRPVAARATVGLDAGGLVVDPQGGGVLELDPAAPRGWRWPAGRCGAPVLAALLDLYVPLCAGPGRERLVVGHLAQSLDGRIATEGGASQFISGPEDLEHAHRMRALFAAVVVGASTVAHDDPRLTTRRVPGAHPTRVVIDPDRRLGTGHALFADGAAPTLVVCRASAAGRGGARHGLAEVVALPCDDDGPLPVAAILAARADRGLRRVFVEGGGVTISRFVAAGALDRLHVVVAPCILGSGRAAFTLPAIDALSDAIDLDCRHVALGRDVLFDCGFPPAAGGGAP